MGNPTCFISYSWDSNEHKDWVRLLAIELSENGVDVRLDQWDTHLGMDLPEYMETCVRESDYVLLVCTPSLAKKANAGEGGSGFEKQIVTGEIFSGSSSPLKFVPILRRGLQNESLPSYLKSKYHLDFRDDNRFEEALEELLRHIYNKPIYEKPPLGPPPKFPTKKAHSKKTPSINATRKAKHRASFQEVYEFALNHSWLNFTPEEARNFASEYLKGYSDITVDDLMKVHSFASSPSGLALNREGANKFTLNWIRDYPDDYVEDLIKIYMFAVSPSGLDYSREDAQQFALSWFRNYPAEDVDDLIEIYKYAVSPSCLAYSREDALAFALNQIIEGFSASDILKGE